MTNEITLLIRLSLNTGSFGSPSLARSPSDASATLILNQSNSDQEMCLSNYHIGSLSIIKNDRSPSKKGTAERREMVHQQAITHANALAKMYEGDAGLREPKAIVFSQHEADLQVICTNDTSPN